MNVHHLAQTISNIFKIIINHGVTRYVRSPLPKNLM